MRMEGVFNSHLAAYLTTPGTRTIRFLWNHSRIEGATAQWAAAVGN